MPTRTTTQIRTETSRTPKITPLRIFAFLSVLFGGLTGLLALMPGPGGQKLRRNLGRIPNGAWAKLEEAFRDAKRSLNGSGKRKLAALERNLKWAGRLIFLWPFLLILAAFTPIQWLEEILVGLLAVVPGAILLTLLTSGRSILGTVALSAGIAIARATGKFTGPLDRIDATIDKLRNAVRVAIGINLVLGVYLIIVPISNDRLLIIPLLLLIGVYLCFMRIKPAMSTIAVIIMIILTLIFFLGGRTRITKDLKKMRSQAKSWVTRNNANVVAAASVNQTGLPVGTPVPVFEAVGYRKEFCEMTTTGEIPDDHRNEPGLLRFSTGPTKPGCFHGPYVIPKNWRMVHIDKSRNKGDWMSVWCDGRPEPEAIHPWYEDFTNQELQGCAVFYLEGEGEVSFQGTVRSPF